MPAEISAPRKDSLDQAAAKRAADAKFSWWKILGPGLITGAADDDPSGIGTYAQAGAMFGYGMLWVVIFTWPLMAATQEISARIGRITGRGLAENMHRTYSRWLTFPIVWLLILANVFNIGADIAAMGASSRMVTHLGRPLLYAAAFAVICLLLEVFIGYSTYSKYLKWLSLALFAYVGTAFVGHVDWHKTLVGLFIPHLSRSGKFVSMFVAVIGTTISPYLFFWQASLETEEIKLAPREGALDEKPRQARGQFRRIRVDTYTGMALSNIIAFFIMLTMAVTIGTSGASRQINTAQDAAAALGQAMGLGTQSMLAVWLFSLGVIGTGMLAVPVLAGSASYAFCEAMAWPCGLNRKFSKAKRFYGILTVLTLAGLSLNFLKGIDPIRALVWSAIINGIVAVPVMALMMRMASDRRVMGEFAKVGRHLRWVGWLATAVMLLAAVGLFATWGQ
jgi:NRAMP (natural resistance-associated macrophage protein)-like metal ion transporter